MRIIRGKFGRRRFDVPSNITARPTTDFARENIFNVMENLVDFEDCEALDLFTGTGAISLELVSRGAKMVTAVEKAPVQYNFIKKIVQQLDIKNLRLIKGDAIRFAQTCTQRFDLIFADPPYDLPDFEKVPEIILNSPMMGQDTLFVLEHSRARDFSHLPYFFDHRAYGSVNFSLFSRALSQRKDEYDQDYDETEEEVADDVFDKGNSRYNDNEEKDTASDEPIIDNVM